MPVLTDSGCGFGRLKSVDMLKVSNVFDQEFNDISKVDINNSFFTLSKISKMILK